MARAGFLFYCRVEQLSPNRFLDHQTAFVKQGNKVTRRLELICMKSTKPLTILLISEEANHNFQQINRLVRSGIAWEVVRESNLQQAFHRLQTGPVDVVLYDVSLLHFNGPYAFKTLLETALHTPIILLARPGEISLAQECIRMGAQDCLIREQFDDQLLVHAIRFSLDRKKSELRLREFTQKLLLITRITGEVIWELDLGTQMVRRDQERLKAVFSIEEQTETDSWNRWLSRIHPDDVHRITGTLSEVLSFPAGDAVQELEYRLRKDDGTFAYVYDHWGLVRSKKGRVVKIMGAAQNNTLKKKAEEKFALIFNKNPIPAWVYDARTLRFLEVNDAALKTYGYSREEFLRMTGKEIRSGEEEEAFEKETQYVLESGTEQRKLWHHRKKSGETILVAVTAYPMDFFGTPAILVQAHDISEEERLRKLLERNEKQKQHEIMEAVLNAEERQRSLIGEELHDNVNQILASAKLYIESALMLPGEQEPLLRTGIRIIGTAVEEIRKLSKELVIPAFGQQSLLEAVQDLSDALELTGNLHVTLQTEGFNEDRLSEGQKVALYRILQEGLNNILKHSGATEVMLALFMTDSQLRMEIRDNGRGFDPSKERKGVGFINMVNRASLYEGKVDIVSAPGKGCHLLINFLLDEAS
jgi:PAS domain S-box-containing protein